MSTICRSPDALLCRSAASAGASASFSSSGGCRSENDVVCSKFSVLRLSNARILSETTAAAAAFTPVVQKLNYGVVEARNSSARLVVASAAAAARRRRRANFEDEDDDEDYWGMENLEEFHDTDGEESAGEGIRKASTRTHSETGPGDVRREEKVDDWVEMTRQRAILSIQERGLSVTALLEEGRRKKKKKKTTSRKKKQIVGDAKLDRSLRTEIDRTSPAPRAEYVEPPMDNPFVSALGSGQGFKGLAGLGIFWKGLSQTGEIRIQQDTGMREVELLIENDSELVRPGLKSRASKGPQRASGRQRYQEDFDLNRSLVEASSAKDVLSVVSSVFDGNPWGQGECFVSPMNISTALHRIAKHMEAESMHKSDRLSFARHKTMALLVSAATEFLPLCSAQSIANIAWALSKVGGSSLYQVEMDLLAQAAMSKISDLETQHTANISGAFAAMQHSVPVLFEALDQRACSLCRNFQSQELAQLLWAFATLNEPAKFLLDSLDAECENLDNFTGRMLSGSVPNGEELYSTRTSGETYFSSYTMSELCSLAWSFTVLNELKRPSFALIWNQIVKRSQGNAAEVQEMAGRCVQLSQLYQVYLSLELEYPELNYPESNLLPGESLRALAQSEWEWLKGGKMTTSTGQKDVEMLLASTGRHWVGEYSAASHSLDIALVEERIGLEIDGPSHFARNTGTALGHTVLKRRQLAGAGWTVYSIPYSEWDELFGEQEQMKYLRYLLRNHF